MSILAPTPVRGLPPPSPRRTPKASTSQLKPTSAPRTPQSLSRTPSRPPSRTERKFACKYEGCTKTYFKPSRLAEHERTHTGERPHVCHCGQSYLRASHLAAHARTHKDEKEKPFACPRCSKRFWTATHLRRHESAHDTAEEHVCPEVGCGQVFAKSHLLREHYVTHLPEGSKPFPCSCGKSFSTKQQLRTHEKTHDPSRYTCSHSDHGLDLPTFPVWTALQAHIRECHPPTCPHVECEGRTFKSTQRLKEHLKVHAEREEDIANGGESEVDLPIIAEAMGRRRRKRTEEESERPRKLPRLPAGEAGKDWLCGAPGCGRGFKSRFARDEHAQAAHSTGRHRCSVCGRAYRRPASLKRHVAGGWCGEGGEGGEGGEELREEEKEAVEGVEGEVGHDGDEQLISIKEEDHAGLLLGTATMPGGSAFRRWGCPYCPDRFHRVYDIQRHLGSSHGVVVDDLGTRAILIADGQTGERNL